MAEPWLQVTVRDSCAHTFDNMLAHDPNDMWLARAMQDFVSVRDARKVHNWQIELIVVRFHGIRLLRDWLRSK